jgi:hypothetical protein
MSADGGQHLALIGTALNLHGSAPRSSAARREARLMKSTHLIGHGRVR